MKDVMLHPDTWSGISTDCTINNMEWLQDLGKHTWCHLWLRWPSKQEISIPQGYNLYIVSFHLEVVDLQWLWDQSKQIEAPIIVLTDCDYYDAPLPPNVIPHRFFWWHEQLELIKKWHSDPATKKITHQFSAICNRITQSKLLVTTALLELKTDSIIKLSLWKGDCANLKTGNAKLDRLHDIFQNNWYGKNIDLEDTHTTFRNHQYYTSNPWTDVYQKCALHFTNESFHFSYMQDEFGSYTYPGPFITEKTLKCLAGATGFIPVGQFDTYKKLTDVGFKFDYNFDIGFDSDKGNISRLAKIIDLTTELATWTAEDLFEATKESSNHNQDHVYSNKLFDTCNAFNQNTVNTILDKFSA